MLTLRSFRPVVFGVVLATRCSPPTPAVPDAAPADAGAQGAVTRVVGPQGASLMLGDAVLVVPPGALPTSTAITVTRTDLGAPAGYTLDSAIYRFEPAGLTFVSPALITFTVRGTSRINVYWSRSTGPGYERLPTILGEMQASAAITHFSTGFVGSETEDASAPVDAPPGEDAPVDASAPDAPGDDPADVLADAPADAVMDGESVDSGADAGADVAVMDDVPSPSLTAPRAIAPLSMTAVTTARPTLRWQLAPGTTGARVEVCRDRACATVEQTIDATGASATLPTALVPGAHFWRMRGRTSASAGAATSPVWSFVVGHRSTPVDTALGVIPDFNGDGRADLVAGAPLYSTETGRAYVYAGHTGSFAGVVPTTRLTGSDGIHRGFGSLFATPGDVNGDGFGDLVVGTRNDSGFANRLHVFGGGAGGLATEPTRILDAPASARYFGGGLSGAGDVNGDGYADLLVSSNPQGLSAVGGPGYLFQGSATGLPATPTATLPAPSASTIFGYGLGGVGDVNGDGRADVAVTAAYAPAGAGPLGVHAYVYSGTATGLSATPGADLSLARPNNASDETAVVPLGDLNGDGFADFAVLMDGSTPEDPTTHVASTIWQFSVIFGASPAPSAASIRTITPGPGRSTPAGAGDVNGDGYGDLMVGYSSVGTPRVEQVLVYLGSATGLPATPSATIPTPLASNSYYFGSALAGLGDLNGDTYDDVAIASFGDDNLGRVHVYFGSATGLPTTPSFELRGLDGAGSRFGQALARY